MAGAMDVERRLRVTARALGRHGLAHAYGHCSERLDEQNLLVCAPKPMPLMEPADMGTLVPIIGELPPTVLGEVRIHQQIYHRRPDVGAIIRCMPPAIMALGTAGIIPAPRHGFGAYLADAVSIWDDPQLIRDEARAHAVAQTLGDGVAVVMRGNGLVVASATLLKALVLCWYLEDAARLELSIRGAGLIEQSKVLSLTQCQERATAAGGIFERMGAFLTAGDPEGLLT